MAGDISGAAAFRQTMVSEFRNFEKVLEPSQEARAIFFVGGQAFRLRVSRIGSTDAGLLNIFGHDDNGSPVDIFIYYTQVSYVVEAVSTEKPHRMGF